MSSIARLIIQDFLSRNVQLNSLQRCLKIRPWDAFVDLWRCRRIHCLNLVWLASCKTLSCSSSTYSGFEFWELRASVFIFKCFVFETTPLTLFLFWGQGLPIDTRTVERNFDSGGGGGFENSHWRRGFVQEGARGAGGFWEHPPQKILKCRGSEMVFSTFTMRYFSKGNSTWIRCKMTGNSSASSMYVILNQKHFSSRKVEVLRPSQLPTPQPPGSAVPDSRHIEMQNRSKSKSKSFNRESPESGKWKEVHIQRPSPRFR